MLTSRSKRPIVWLSLLALLVSAGAVFAAFTIHGLRKELAATRAALANSSREVAELRNRRAEALAVLARSRKTLAAELEKWKEEAVRLQREKKALEVERRSLRSALGELRGELQEARRALEEARAALGRAEQENSTTLARLRQKVRALEAARDRALRRAKGYRWRLERAEAQLAMLRSSREATFAWIRRWIGEHVGAVENLLESTGVDPTALLERVGIGQGGPLEPLEKFADPLFDPVEFELGESVLRFRAVQRLLASLPLAAPLDYYHVTSGYGPRRDPITGRRAMHRGIDLGAPPGAKVFAPAPGIVRRAGREGAYGLLVEIDHGMGIVTRYGHLRRILVRAGQRVGFREPIGVVGNTGRSTGRHLHYEIRIDGEPIDPLGFLEASRELVRLLKVEQPSGG